jgi:TfoX/Sxy family transcriptional regulator of competence genes
MAYDENLGTRIATVLSSLNIRYIEKKMFGGLGFMISDKMCVGVIKDELMIRVLDDNYEQVLAMPYARPMDFAKRPMKGFLYIGKEGLVNDMSLQNWIELALEFAEKGVLKSKKKKKAGSQL